jgi:RND family efflux transporter MFP subunit
MKMINKLIITITCISIAAMLFAACKGQSGGDTAGQTEERAIQVIVQAPETGTITDWFRTNGDIQSPLEANVSFSVPGLITDLAADEGDYVEAGQYLGQLDMSIYQAQYRAATSQAQAVEGQAEAADMGVEIAMSQVEQAQAGFNLAETNYNRFKTLRDDGVATQAEFEQVELAYESARLGLEASRDGVTAAQAQAETAHASIQAAWDGAGQIAEIIDNGTLRAPFNGRIVTRMIDPGNVVGAGMPIFMLLGEGDDVARQLELRFNIPERMVGEVNTGSTLFVGLQSCEDEVQVPVHHMGSSVDPDSRTVEVVAYIENDSTCLLPGMYVTVRIPLVVHENAILIPGNAVIDVAGELFVFVAEGDTASKKIVTVGIREGDMVEITSGLEVTDEVVVVGNTFLDDGVRIRKSSEVGSSAASGSDQEAGGNAE